MYRNGFVFRVIGAVLLIALLVAGGTFVYRAGVAQGISQAPQVAQAIQQSAENGNGSPMLYGYGYPPRGFGHHFGFIPFGFFGFLLFLFFFFGLMRLIAFRKWSHMHGGWGKGWEHGVSSKFDEWHKRAHGEESSEVKK